MVWDGETGGKMCIKIIQYKKKEVNVYPILCFNSVKEKLRFSFKLDERKAGFVVCENFRQAFRGKYYRGSVIVRVNSDARNF